MAKHNPTNELEAAISKLRSERESLTSQIAQIDATFARLGIAIATAAAPVKVVTAKVATTGKRRGRPPKAAPVAAPNKPAGKQRKRGSFAVTGEESVLAFVTKAGEPKASEVNAHWTKEGRKATANNTISKLVKEGKLQRVEVPGEHGGRYKIA